MSNIFTIVGNLGADPELRYLPNQTAVASFRVGDTPRRLDKATGQWVNGESLWITCEAWEGLATNVANTLKKGDRVIVQGRIVADSYEDKKTGEKRYSQKLRVDHVGPDLRYATAAITRNPRNDNGGNSGNYQQAPVGNPAEYGVPAGGDDTPF